MLWKCCTQDASKFGKFSNAHRTGKGQFSFQPQRKAMPKNIQTTAQLHSSHTLAKQCSKFSKPRFNSTWTMNFQMFKLDLEKAEEPEIKLPKSTRSSKKQDSSRKISTSALLTTIKPLTVWITTYCEKFLKRLDYWPTWSASREICMQVKKQVRTGHRTTDWFQIRKGVHQGCILSPCLFNLYTEYSMWNARLDEAQIGIKIAGRNINYLRYADDSALKADSEVGLNSLLMKVKEESEKFGLKLNIQKTKIMSSGPITSWKIDGKTVRNYFLGLQNQCRWWLQPWN